MKYYVSLFIVLMLVLPSCSTERPDQSHQRTANDPILSLGMSHQLALEIIRDCGGEDVTGGQAVVGRNGEWPLSGLYWSFEQYDSIIEIGAKDGKLVGISYWTGADFSVSKLHRVESRKELKSLTFDKQNRTVKTQLL